ncbi:MAG: serine hydrolase domain-containing protein, partial [Pseudomonadota bacterium]
ADAPDWAAVETIVNDGVKAGLFPGATICAMKGDEVLRSRAFGLANLETRAPTTTDTVFRIASITKQFAGASLLLLQEDGRLSLDDPLAKFFPEFPKADEISLRDLATHMSGLGSYTNAASMEAFMQAARTDYDADAMMEALLAAEPLFVAEPGAAWHYSNTGYMLIDFVIAKASEMSFKDFVAARICGPLGLARTAVDDAADIVRGRASGYTLAPDASDGFANANYISMTYAGAAGAMRSTAPELAQWARALLGGQVLTPESFAEMLKPATTRDGAAPIEIPQPGKEPETPREVAYGLGVNVGLQSERGEAVFGARRVVQHQGGIFGFASHLRSFPDEEVSIAMLFNCDGGGEEAFHETFEEIRNSASLAALG